jgi:hypothetical protein
MVFGATLWRMRLLRLTFWRMRLRGGEEKLILVPDFSYHVPSEHPKGYR